LPSTKTSRSNAFQDHGTKADVPLDQKKPYRPPNLFHYHPDGVPEWLIHRFARGLTARAFANRLVAPLYTAVVDFDRRYVRVSDSFCQLLGYESEELIGKRYDDITAPKTADIAATFTLFKNLGYMYGLWMLVHRTGKRILVRYESWLRADSFIETNMEVVEHLR
jgi:PAS domain S-box-containing protein